MELNPELDQALILKSFYDWCQDPNRETLVMGILNVTPDSFSDGGLFYNTDEAVSHAIQLIEYGIDIIDIGGESTRPGAEKISEKCDTPVEEFKLNIEGLAQYVAEGIVDALKKIEIKVPLVIRLAGTNVEKGNKILKESKINYIEANTLEDAANKAVAALNK